LAMTVPPALLDGFVVGWRFATSVPPRDATGA
jgi:hypothetical protein